ncbi:MAG: M48 family metallopeptidase [Verrucomicrobiae bacterium]|nr:M48 family metallopeptidase [Verrucomicrobiae bacterium]
MNDPRRTWLWILPAALIVLLAACTTLKETGESTVILVNPQQETQLGVSAFDQYKKEKKVSPDPQHQEMVNRVGRKLAAVSGLSDVQWEFVVFEDPSPNAFALPGGKVGFNTGILDICQDEEGIAVVMSHEIAHVSLRHGAQRMSRGMMLEMGRNLLGLAMQDSEYKTQQLFAMSYGLGSQIFVELPYGRDEELEADRIGLRYLSRAGYRPQASVEFWQRFAAAKQKSGAAGGSDFLSTHPSDQKRIEQLQKAVSSGQY